MAVRAVEPSFRIWHATSDEAAELLLSPLLLLLLLLSLELPLIELAVGAADKVFGERILATAGGCFPLTGLFGSIAEGSNRHVHAVITVALVELALAGSNIRPGSHGGSGGGDGLCCELSEHIVGSSSIYYCMLPSFLPFCLVVAVLLL